MDAVLNLTMTENITQKSVAQTIREYGKQLFSFIKSRVNIVEDAEDILQEVWYQFSNLTNIDALENASAWLYAVSRNKITDFYRKKKTAFLEDHSYEDEEGNLSVKDMLLLDNTENPEWTMYKSMVWDELIKALNELPENQRYVFVQNEIEDKTLQEIADELNENIKTIISRKGYAVRYLRKKLQTLYNEINQ